MLQVEEGGARASAARKPFSTRIGKVVLPRSNSSNSLCASAGLSVPERTRSVAAIRAARGARDEGAMADVGVLKTGERLTRGIADPSLVELSAPVTRLARRGTNHEPADDGERALVALLNTLEAR